MNMHFHTVLLAAVTVTFFSAPALAQTDHSKHGSTAAKPAVADAAMGDAVVKKIDKAGKKITLAHGALPNGMPAMTMAYAVKDATLLDGLKEGQKIRFATDPKDSMTVLRFEVAK
jgi:Cu/Ag efflux protein CusF